MALAALERRDDVPEDWVDAAIRALPRPSYCEDAFQLRRSHGTPGPGDRPAPRPDRGDQPGVRRRLRRGEDRGGRALDVETFRGHVTAAQAEDLEASSIASAGTWAIWCALRSRSGASLELFGSIGRVWQRPFDRPPALLVGRRSELVDLVVAALDGRAAALGPARRRARRREDRARPRGARPDRRRHGVRGDGVAGDRRPDLRRRARGPREAARGGDARTEARSGSCPSSRRRSSPASTHRSPQGLLDALLPHIEAGDDHASSPRSRPTAFELLVAAAPAGRGASSAPRATARRGGRDRRRSSTRSSTTALDVADRRRDARARPTSSRSSSCRASRRREACSASSTRPRREAAEDGRDDVRRRRRARDARRALRAAARAARPGRAARPRGRPRVLRRARPRSSREAVDCVVERIAMIKAGLTDPTRPLGVFLFVGPTGTGKTEIAKALAEFLFGSPRPARPARHERVPDAGVPRAAARATRASTSAARR